MAHESFEDAQVAKALKGFVCIKVDREERSDIDAVYMNVCQTITGSGGWPLTVIMTPEQKPFFAGTYLPKNPKYGGVGLIRLLQKVERLWKIKRDKLVQESEHITDIINADAETGSAQPSGLIIQKAANMLGKTFDKIHGGFGDAPKFPTPHNLMFLLRYSKYDASVLDMVHTTLQNMYKGGIFDHIGGGFSRYSTDRLWLAPHFEKMLYDNALLSYTYVLAYKTSGRKLYKDVAQRTIDYVLRELTHERGGFLCGQDADSDGVEGKYYVFKPEEILSVLGEEQGTAYCDMFDITQMGNFEGQSIPNLLKSNAEHPIQSEQLYEYRLKRTHLHKDDKILTSWNALMIAALCIAGRTIDSRYLQNAQKAQKFIEEQLTDSRGRLLVRWRQGQAMHDGQIDDYAFYCWALIELYQSTYDPIYLQKCVKIAQDMIELFFDEQNGGFFMYAHDAQALISRPKELYDGALPSGNSVAAYVLGRLFRLTADPKFGQYSQRQMEYIAGGIYQYPSAYTFSLMAMMEQVFPAYDLVCASAQDVCEQLHSIDDDVCILLKTPGKDISQIAPFTNDYAIPEKGAAYYLCKDKTCYAPVYNIKDLNL